MKNRILKYLIVPIIASGMAMNAFAVNNGLYLGLMMGPSNNGGGTQGAQVLSNVFTIQTTPATPKSQQFSSRIYIGNKFNKYAAFELGFQFFSTIKYDTKGVQTLGGTTERVRDIDIVGKGILPFGNSFDVFGKAGIAYTYVTTGSAFNAQFSSNPDPGNPPVTSSSVYKTKTSPTISLGVSYAFSQSWVADFTYTTVQAGGAVGNVSALMLGISYHFVDVYCGQFLCDD